MENNNFLKLYFAVFYKPQKAFGLIFDSNEKLKFGFYAFLVPSLGYTLFYILAYFAGGSPSTFKPWLNLPIQEYFRYDIFLTFPGYLLSWVGAASIVYLFSKLIKGAGSFDDTLVTIGFSIGVATWSSLLHDLIDAVLACAGIINMREYEKLLNEPTFWRTMLWTLYSIYFIWFITLFVIGLKKAHKLSLQKSIILAFLTLVVFQTILLIFIR